MADAQMMAQMMGQNGQSPQGAGGFRGGRGGRPIADRLGGKRGSGKFQGKEMKVASSQSCSRYLEKVIALSTADQLEALFRAFLENLPYLAQHRFGSHCCETLFVHAAKHTRANNHDTTETDQGLERCFLQAAEKLESNVGFLLTERFASHTIRILLLVLSGQPTDDESTKSVVASERKEKLDGAQTESASVEPRKVPKSFTQALHHLMSVAVSSIDTTYLRALATHPIGNPILQLLLRLQLTGYKKAKSEDEENSAQTVLVRHLASGDRARRQSRTLSAQPFPRAESEALLHVTRDLRLRSRPTHCDTLHVATLWHKSRKDHTLSRDAETCNRWKRMGT